MMLAGTIALFYVSYCTVVVAKRRIGQHSATESTHVQWKNGGHSNKKLESSYQKGERTEGLRIAVLKAKRLRPSDDALVERNQTWFISVNDVLKAIHMQGYSTEKIQGKYTFIRTEDGSWYKLHEVANSTKAYLSGLPWQYDDTKQVTFDGKNILIRRKKGLYSRVTNLIDMRKKVVYVQEEDGGKLQIPMNKDTLRFKAIFKSLPTLEDDFPLQTRAPLPDPVAKIKKTHEAKLSNRKERLRALSDDILCEVDGSWHIEDDNNTHEIVLNGLTLEKAQQPFIIARAQDGSWHMFLKVPDRFRLHVATLPWVQVGLGRLTFDGRYCYVKKPFGGIVKIYMRGKMKGQEFKAHGQDDRIYNCYAFGKCLHIIKKHIFERPSEDKIRTKKEKN